MELSKRQTSTEPPARHTMGTEIKTQPATCTHVSLSMSGMPNASECVCVCALPAAVGVEGEILAAGSGS